MAKHKRGRGRETKLLVALGTAVALLAIIILMAD